MRRLLLLLPLAAALAACGAERPPSVTLEEVAVSDRQWTGVAVSHRGRLFVCFPRWSQDVPVSVAEVGEGGALAPYPPGGWNDWSPDAPPSERFVCVQSVHVDDEDVLWILDPANPRFEGVVPGGPKLLRVALEADIVVGKVPFGEDAAPPGSYLNDVRVDTRTRTAYVTDSGLGAILVVDLAAGASRRVLADHPSTKSEGVEVVVEGRPWRRPDGARPQVHADGLALSRDGAWLYYQALTARTLYRVPTEALRDATLAPDALAARVEQVAESGVADGILFGPDGHVYLTALEADAIRRLRPGGRVETVVTDPRLAWPDSLAWSLEGWIYVTTSQIHRMPQPAEPYRLLRLRP